MNEEDSKKNEILIKKFINDNFAYVSVERNIIDMKVIEKEFAYVKSTIHEERQLNILTKLSQTIGIEIEKLKVRVKDKTHNK